MDYACLSGRRDQGRQNPDQHNFQQMAASASGRKLTWANADYASSICWLRRCDILQ